MLDAVWQKSGGLLASMRASRAKIDARTEPYRFARIPIAVGPIIGPFSSSANANESSQQEIGERDERGADAGQDQGIVGAQVVLDVE